MLNVVVKKTKGGLLSIEVDPTQEHGRSKSGKTMIVASTQGNVQIPGTDLILGLNIYKK